MFSRNAEGGCVVPSVLKSLAGVVCIPAISLLAAPDFYVSPTGNDGASGTSPQEPLATIQKAQEKVRAVNSNMSEDIHVNLMGGTYQLTETINFGTADGGSNGHYVVYQAHEDQKPVLSGGVRITGWTEVADKPGVYKADISSYGFHEKGFRQLYVDGIRCIRAREPNLHPRDIGDVYLGNRDVDYYTILEWRNSTRKIRVWPSSVEGISDWTGIEFVALMTWTHNYLWIERTVLQGEFAGLELHEKHRFLWTRKCPPKGDGQRFYLENAYQFLDTTGEFFVNTTDKAVYYVPRDGESMTTAHVVAPRLEKLVDVKGTLDNPVRNIRFEGLTFDYSTWMLPSEEGNTPIQTEMGQFFHNYDGVEEFNVTKRPGSAVQVEAAERIDFRRNVFQRLGSTALDIYRGADTCTIEGNVFRDISGMGMCVAEFSDTTMEIHWPYEPEDDRRVTDNTVIKNNYFHRVGQCYYGACGIAAGYARNLTISHNTLHELPYTAISVGWGWRTHQTKSENTLIRGNRINAAMRFLQDGGGIYTLGNQPGSSIDSNAIYNMRRYAPEYGLFFNIYLDEGTSNLFCGTNYIDSTDNPGEMIRFNTFGQATIVLGKNGNEPNVSYEVFRRAGVEARYEDILPVKPHRKTGPRSGPHSLRLTGVGGGRLQVVNPQGESLTIRLLGANGRVVRSIDSSREGEFVLNLTGLSASVYYLNLKTEAHTLVYPILIPE